MLRKAATLFGQQFVTWQQPNTEKKDGQEKREILTLLQSKNYGISTED